MSEKLICSSNIFSNYDLKSEFLKWTYSISKLARNENLFIIPTSDISLPDFSRLPLQQQFEIVEKVKSYHQVLESTAEKFGTLRNNASVVWMGLKSLGLTPQSDYFSNIEEDDVVEIYGANQKLLFGNLRFFELSGYTLEQLHCVPWEKLYARDNSILDLIRAGVEEVFLTKKTVAFSSNIHVVCETCSPLKNTFHYSLKYLSPLFARQTKELAGFSSVGAVVFNTLNADRERMLGDFYKMVDNSPIPQLI